MLSRLLIVFLLFAFVAQLQVSYTVNKKSEMEWSDTDYDASDSEDDSNDSEGEEKDDYNSSYTPRWNGSVSMCNSNCSKAPIGELKIYKQNELLFSIDNPPEIS